jgi:hypothetical protein
MEQPFDSGLPASARPGLSKFPDRFAVAMEDQRRYHYSFICFEFPRCLATCDQFPKFTIEWISLAVPFLAFSALSRMQSPSTSSDRRDAISLFLMPVKPCE